LEDPGRVATGVARGRLAAAGAFDAVALDVVTLDAVTLDARDPPVFAATGRGAAAAVSSSAIRSLRDSFSADTAASRFWITSTWR
jgi:hypothetical protein